MKHRRDSVSVWGYRWYKDGQRTYILAQEDGHDEGYYQIQGRHSVFATVYNRTPTESEICSSVTDARRWIRDRVEE